MRPSKLPIVDGSILPHAEFRPNDNLEDAPHFTSNNYLFDFQVKQTVEEGDYYTKYQKLKKQIEFYDVQEEYIKVTFNRSLIIYDSWSMTRVNSVNFEFLILKLKFAFLGQKS